MKGMEHRFAFRRGLNRTFFVLWALYFLAFSWSIFNTYHEYYRKQVDGAYFLHTPCLKPYEECSKELKEKLDTIEEEFSVAALAYDDRWLLAWVVPALLIVPPMLLYGLVLAILKTLAWIARGFQAEQR